MSCIRKRIGVMPPFHFPALLATAVLFSTSLAVPSALRAQTGADWSSQILHSRCEEITPAVRAGVQIKNIAALEAEAAMYDRGCGVPQNMRRAAELYAQAIALGAKDGLAAGYVDLYGRDPSEETGIARLTLAAKSGNTIAARDLSFYYNHQLDASANAENAFRWASLAARDGDAVASADLGQFYLDGRGVGKNVPLGRSYSDRGVIANVPEALVTVGVEHMLGSAGYAKDHVEGLRLLRKAIELGSARAKMLIALVADKNDYADGRISESEAEAYAESSAQVLEPKRFYDLNLAQFWYSAGNRNLPDCTHALPLLLEVENGGIPSIDYGIGYCYDSGNGVAKNEQLAFKYFRLAAQKGSPDAIAFLKSMESGPNQSNNSTADDWHNYEGYHWNELHPMEVPANDMGSH